MNATSLRAPRCTALAQHTLGLIMRVGPVCALATMLSTSRFLVQGHSMEPSFTHGQHILVSRMAYWIDAPGRGDIVVVRDSQWQRTELLKRIVGLPGEHVRIEKGCSLVDGQRMDESYLGRQGPWLSKRDGEWFLEADNYFVLGDNRDDSLDSRVFGPVKFSFILGKAWVRYWPPYAFGRLLHDTCVSSNPLDQS